MIKKYSTLQRQAELQGEFWLIGGQAVFADGDVGDLNHEGIVIQSLLSDLVEEVNSEIGSRMNPEFVELATVEDTIYNYLAQEADKEVDVDLVQEFILETIGFEEEKLDVLAGRIDARDYGLKNLGWVRVKQENVQTYTLTPEQMKDIARGLADAYNEDVDTHTFVLEVSATGKYYTDVPYSVLETGNPGALREYEQAY